MSGDREEGSGFPHRHVSVQIAMARDWAGICQRRATDLLGTREATVTTAYLDAARTALRRLCQPRRLPAY